MSLCLSFIVTSHVIIILPYVELLGWVVWDCELLRLESLMTEVGVRAVLWVLLWIELHAAIGFIVFITITITILDRATRRSMPYWHIIILDQDARRNRLYRLLISTWERSAPPECGIQVVSICIVIYIHVLWWGVYEPGTRTILSDCVCVCDKVGIWARQLEYMWGWEYLGI